MFVSVRHKTNVYTYPIDNETTVGEIRMKIVKELDCSKEAFSIKYGVVFMLDHKIISHLNMGKADYLEVIFEKIQVIINTILINEKGVNKTGAVKSYLVDPGETVLKLKEEIGRKEKMDPKFMKLTYGGEFMDNEKLIYQYRIGKDGQITMISYVDGGLEYLNF